jgi:CRP/FNR family transcriptional regulator, dissimilatory nitrate respiration regulator
MAVMLVFTLSYAMIKRVCQSRLDYCQTARQKTNSKDKKLKRIKQIVGDKDRILECLAYRPLFQAGGKAFVESVAAQARLITAEKGQLLFTHQQPASHFYIILKGWIKLFRETLDGAQAVVDILPHDHMFGETSIFENDIYPFSAEAAETSLLVSMPLSLLKTEIENNPKMAHAMLSAMARYRKQQDQELEHRTLQTAPQRLGCFLLRLADHNANGPVVIHLPYDKMLVASRLGMQPETFSRALTRLREATGIQVKGATIEMESLDQLTSFSCSACSSEFPCKDL